MGNEEFECDCCGTILNKEQKKIEKSINVDMSPCYCSLIIQIDKKNKQIKKLKKSNSEHISFFMDRDNLLDDFLEWQEDDA